MLVQASPHGVNQLNSTGGALCAAPRTHAANVVGSSSTRVQGHIWHTAPHFLSFTSRVRSLGIDDLGCLQSCAPAGQRLGFNPFPLPGGREIPVGAVRDVGALRGPPRPPPRSSGSARWLPGFVLSTLNKSSQCDLLKKCHFCRVLRASRHSLESTEESIENRRTMMPLAPLRLSVWLRGP